VGHWIWKKMNDESQYQSNLQKFRAHNLLMVYVFYYCRWDDNSLPIYSTVGKASYMG
jgi:hypothetical protein